MMKRATRRGRLKEDQAATKRRVLRMLRSLEESMPEARVELSHKSPWELLVATVLSAQCTDQRVNQVTPALFRRYHRPADYAAADRGELETLIRRTGFFRSKADHLIACGRAVAERFRGSVPDTMETLTSLPGVGRKTANVILGNVFGKQAVVVDTHVKRVAARLGLTQSTDPDRIETDLQQLLPPGRWTEGSQRLLLHGRYVCLARKPLCHRCRIYDDCPSPEKQPR
ncbi:MAG: endonuclease III [Nitrospiraceae bacterium]